jgi:hypothetical protein
MKKTLQANGFKPHNNKSKELVASKFHSTLRNVRIVVSTGLDKNTGKAIAGKQAQFKAVFINNQSQWRTIATGSTFKGTGRFGSALTAIEVGAEDASTCKRCGAKNFKAKSGNVVCANACWANNGWSRGQKKNTSQNTYAASQKRNAAARKHNRAASRSAAQKKQLRADCLAKQKAEKEAQAKIDVTKYTTFVPGQLVKIVEPQQLGIMKRPDDDGNIGEGPDFIGTVTKVEIVSDRPNDLLANVSVMWMHSGVTSRHNNYNSGSGTATYLVPVA